MSAPRRRTLLRALGTAAALPALPRLARAQNPRPRITLISQWAAGSDGAAMTKLGKLFEEQGGQFEHNPVPGFTTEMMNKLRAEILAGNPPACSQLKGPEIAAWSKIAPTVNLNDVVREAGYEAVVAPDLAKLHKPGGNWAALPLQVYRINTLFASKKAMDKVGATALPKTWAEFNALAEKMKAAGIIPVANGGIRWDDGMKFEIALGGLSPDAYRKAIMELDDKTLRGPEVVAALAQTRKLSDWLPPGVAGQHYSTFLPKFVSGEAGMLLMGGWAQGVIRHLGHQDSDYLLGPAPQDNGKPAFILNADALIFWQRREPEFKAGQQQFAKLVMQPATQTMYSQTTGSIPVRTDIDLNGPGWSDGQRNAAQGLAASVQANQVMLSLAHNMAQTNQITAGLIEVLTEFVHNKSITPQQAATRLADAADAAR